MEIASPVVVNEKGDSRVSRKWERLALRGSMVVLVAWALVGAGAVVVKDVAAHSMVLGNPAKHVAWVGRAGVRLDPIGGDFVCPETGERYRLAGDELELFE